MHEGAGAYIERERPAVSRIHVSGLMKLPDRGGATDACLHDHILVFCGATVRPKLVTKRREQLNVWWAYGEFVPRSCDDGMVHAKTQTPLRG